MKRPCHDEPIPVPAIARYLSPTPANKVFSFRNSFHKDACSCSRPDKSGMHYSVTRSNSECQNWKYLTKTARNEYYHATLACQTNKPHAESGFSEKRDEASWACAAPYINYVCSRSWPGPRRRARRTAPYTQSGGSV